MYVKLFTQILDSSIAENRKLRHFFTDLLLCADSKGYVIMTDGAIARRIGADLAEVQWGLAELQKPDTNSKTPDHAGTRIEKLEGSGYGYHIINYETYRAFKDADQLREAVRVRVKRCRTKKDDEESKEGEVVNEDSVTLRNVTQRSSNAITDASASVSDSSSSESESPTKHATIAIAHAMKAEGFPVAWKEWIEHHDLLCPSQKYTSSSLRRVMVKLQRLGPARAVQCINFSIEKNAKGLIEDFEEQSSKKQPGPDIPAWERRFTEQNSS